MNEIIIEIIVNSTIMSEFQKAQRRPENPAPKRRPKSRGKTGAQKPRKARELKGIVVVPLIMK